MKETPTCFPSIPVHRYPFTDTRYPFTDTR